MLNSFVFEIILVFIYTCDIRTPQHIKASFGHYDLLVFQFSVFAMNMTYHLLPSSVNELNSYANLQNFHYVKTIFSCFQDAIFISENI